MNLVATASLCRGCLTPGHGVAVRTCPFRRELKGLCAKLKCKQSIISCCTWRGNLSSARITPPGGAPMHQISTPCI
jgi:hypothetical protein